MAATVFIGVWLILFAATLGDYGPAWDIWELPFGDRQVMFYATLDPIHLDPANRPPLALYSDPRHPDFTAIDGHARDAGHHMWPLGPTVSSLSKFLLWRWLGWLEAIDAHHAALAPFVLLLFAVLFRWVRRNIGPVAAFTAIVALATFPRFWADAHFNLKDVPSTVMFSLVVMTFHTATLRSRAGGVLLTGCLAGMALAAKANALFLPVVLGPWLIYHVWRRRQEGLPFLPRRFRLALAAAPALAAATAAALWPYLLFDFPHRIGMHVRYLLTEGSRGGPGFKVMPLLHLITTMPPPMLALLTAGLGMVAVRTVRARRLSSLDALLLLWLVVPVLRVSAPRANDFDVIRHWLEFLPAAAVLAGSAVQSAVDAARRRFPVVAAAASPGTIAGLVVLWFSPAIVWNLANHPHQIAYYNCLAGGLGGAQRRGWPQATDYAGVCYRQGMHWLNRNAERGGVVIVPVAPQLAAAMGRVWLRSDLVLQAPPWTPAGRTDPRASVYLMFITRREWFSGMLADVDRNRPAAFTITVDGGDILKIVQFVPVEKGTGVISAPQTVGK